ncbi:MAG: COX15/CtaA family protein [Ilumatobacteraceae bacterium]
MSVRVSPAKYRIATMTALVFLYVIVVSGALVRLTASGLGCVDWPNCNSNRFVDVSSKHAAIEQINRLFTGAVSAAVLLAVLGALFRTPRRRDLTWLSLGLVAGVIGQAVLGAFVVWSHLNPVLVQGHFLLSMVLMANALVLHRRAGQPDGGRRVRLVPAQIATHAWAVVVLTAVAIVAGTVTTGAGPHSGSVDGEPVRRFGIDISTIARLHALAVWATVAAVLALAWRIRNDAPTRRRLEPAITRFVVIAVFQGAVGYIQYFSGVPIVLVAIHVFLATAVWLAAIHLAQVTTEVVEPVGVSPGDPTRTDEVASQPV